MTVQLSLFGVAARPPAPVDLEGLLAGAGQVTRMGGTARVSIVVDEPWRATALVAECGLRGLAATVQRVVVADAQQDPATVEGHLAVRTAYAAALAPIGRRWLHGGVKRPPDGFFLDGRRLRFWATAAGRPDGAHGYVLALGPNDAPMWEITGAALVALGLPAALLGPRAGGPAYRIVGRRRLARLAELVGDAPPSAPAGAWL